MNRRVGWWLLAVGVLFGTTACDDPGSVGVDLVDEQTGRPVVVELPTTTFEAADADDVTGNSERVLAGSVEDPMLGTIASTGYVDFAGLSGLTGAFATGVISEVTLDLIPDYVYGDTTEMVTMLLSDMSEDWDPQGGRADTTITSGASVLEFSFLPTDTLVTISLPETWIDANATALQSSTFSVDFHGFELSSVSGNAVVGFIRLGSALRVTVGTETASYPASQTLSTQTRDGVPDVPDNRLLLQDGLGPGVLFRFDFNELENSAVSRVLFRFLADTLASQANTPPNFVRPLLSELELFTLNADDQFVFLERTTLDEEGRFIFDSGILRQNLQQIFLGENGLDSFQLGVRTTASTLDAILLHDVTVADTAPEAQLTVIPVGQ